MPNHGGSNFVDAEINGESCSSPRETSLISVFKYAGLILPRFCFHNNLAVAGNCRACLLEVVSIEKPVAACVTDLEWNFQVWSESPFALKARENVLEILLANHPLDCPICDQAGECDLQDQAKAFGNGFSRFFLQKRGVIDKRCGPIIKTIMTRCIHCTRCIRFTTLIDGPKFGILNRGSASEIGLYVYKKKETKLLGNVIDLCPVGALTARAYAFKSRPWELQIVDSLDPTDALGSSIYVSVKGVSVIRVSPKPNKYVNGNMISDKCRYSQSRGETNRLNKPYGYCNTDSTYKNVSWFSFLNTQARLNVVADINLLVSPEISFNILLHLKQLANFACGKLKLKAVKTALSSLNYYYYAFQTLQVLDMNINTCLLFSANPQTEAALLSFKLKRKYQKSLLTLFSFGPAFVHSGHINFLNLSFKSLLLLAEAKTKKSGSFFFSKVTPLLIFGYSFIQRYANFLSFFLFLRKKLNTLVALKLNKFCNDESLLLLNIKQYFQTNSHNTSAYCLNLYDHLVLQKSILSSTNHKVWFSYQKPIGSRVRIFNFLLPTFSFFEENHFFVSLENRVQSARRVFSSLVDGRSLQDILSALFFFQAPQYENLFISFLNEQVAKFALSSDNSLLSSFQPWISSVILSAYAFKTY